MVDPRFKDWETVPYGWDWPIVQKKVWHDDGYWWCASEIEDDPHGPFDTDEEACEFYKEMN